MTGPIEGPTETAVRRMLARYGPMSTAEIDALLESVIADGLVTKEGEGDRELS